MFQNTKKKPIINNHQNIFRKAKHIYFIDLSQSETYYCIYSLPKECQLEYLISLLEGDTLQNSNKCLLHKSQ